MVKGSQMKAFELERRILTGEMDKYFNITPENLKELKEAEEGDRLNKLSKMANENFIGDVVKEFYVQQANKLADRLIRENQHLLKAVKDEEERPRKRRRKRPKKVKPRKKFLPKRGKNASYSKEEKLFLKNNYKKGVRGKELKESFNNNFPGRARDNKPQSFNRRALQFNKGGV